jgi:hypothetical protein
MLRRTREAVKQWVLLVTVEQAKQRYIDSSMLIYYNNVAYCSPKQKPGRSRQPVEPSRMPHPGVDAECRATQSASSLPSPGKCPREVQLPKDPQSYTAIATSSLAGPLVRKSIVVHLGNLLLTTCAQCTMHPSCSQQMLKPDQQDTAIHSVSTSHYMTHTVQCTLWTMTQSVKPL